MAGLSFKMSNSQGSDSNHMINPQMLPSDLPNSHIPVSLRVISPSKGVMSQFYFHQLNLSRAKLKNSSRTSALLSGFAMVAMVEINLDSTIPDGLLTAFSICTTLLVAVHLLALMISTCVLPHVEAVATMTPDCLNGQVSQALKSPHETMHAYIETAWIFSTVLGIILFLIEIGLLVWIQFHNSWNSKISSTIILVPIVLIFLYFAFQFYRKLVKHTYKGLKEDLDDIERRFEVFHEQSSCVHTV